MRFERNKILLVLISLVVIASGCVDNGDSAETQTNPVTVTDFSPSQASIPSDTTLSLDIEIENEGQADAEDIAVRLFGPTFASSSDQDSAWRSSSEEAMDSRADRTFTMGDANSPGDGESPIPSTESITLTAPSYGEGRAPTETFNLDVFYRYETQAGTQMTMMSEDRYLDSDTTETSAETDNDSGPIQLEVLGTTPKVQYDDDGDDTDDFCVMVRDEGPGTPFLHDESYHEDTEDVYSVDSDYEDIVEIEAEDVGDIVFEPGSGETGEDTEEGAKIETELVNDEARACFEWSSPDMIDQEEITSNINLVASYGYNIEEQTTVTVEGR